MKDLFPTEDFFLYSNIGNADKEINLILRSYKFE